MASFDINKFATSINAGEGLAAGGVAALGLPSCILELGELALAIIPAPILFVLDRMLAKFQEKVDEILKIAYHYIAQLFGIVQYVTNLGNISLKIDGISDLEFWIPAALRAIIELGAQAYQFVQDIQELYEDIKECLDQIRAALETQSSSADNALPTDAEVARELAKIEEAQKVKAKADAVRARIANELLLRQKDPNREPAMNPAYAEIFAGTTFRIGEPAEEVEDLIRLVFGPSRSTEDNFVLSVDGLYYDSQGSEGLVPVLTQLRDRSALLDPSERWKFSFDPNLGGKGEQINKDTFGNWVNSIFDLNIIDDSHMMQDHYDKDGFLLTLIGQRDKRIRDVNTQIASLEAEGLSDAVINNFKQSLLSENAQHESKINRRKKQIEIAVKAPGFFAGLRPFEPGRVPINDFSYLQEYNISLALEDQKKLVINTEDVSGIVLPVAPKFVKASPKNVPQTIDHLYIPDMGFDSIITDGLNANDASAAELAMDEFVSTEGLFALYNFLNSKVELPSSLNMSLNNCVTPDTVNNAQIVSKTTREVFIDLGLASPYFKGITENSNILPSALGSFVKLPDSREFQDWTYNKTGFSFETWVHMPTLEDSDIGWKDNGVSSLYRLILANENTGIKEGVIRTDSYNLVPYTDSTEYTKGMIFGFTTDQRWTLGELPSNDFSLQNPSVGYGLVLAPTISYDSSTATFMSKGSCEVDNGWYGMYIPSSKQTSNGKTLADCVNSYMQLAFSVDYLQDIITVYLDGEVLETSAVSEVFGTRKGLAIRLPSFKQANSFDYNADQVGLLAPKSLKNGPKTYPFFTPWILGGGYTDGNAHGGNFMGGSFGGIISGLRGFLGSVKFYSKSVTKSDIQKNYKVQEKLFKQLKWTRTVILAIGQSNMDGSFEPLANMPEKYQNPIEGVKIWDPFTTDLGGGNFEGSWVTLDPTINNNRSRYLDNEEQTPPPASRTPNLLAENRACPMLSFMSNLSEFETKSSSIKENNVYLIKNAYPGIYMFDFGGQSSSGLSLTFSAAPADVVPHYHKYYEIKRDLHQALENIPKPFKVKTVVLIQGEQDSTVFYNTQFLSISSLVADSWGQFFEVFYNRVQTELKEIQNIQSDTPWIIARTHKELPDYGPFVLVPGVQPRLLSFHYLDRIRAQQEALAEREDLKVSFVDIDGLTFRTDIISQPYDVYDTVHFDGPGLVEVGNRFFAKYKEISGYT